MTANYKDLQGLIISKGITHGAVAEAIGLTSTSFSLKLNNRNDFTQTDILKICKVLSIPVQEIPFYFFSEKVQWADEAD